MKSDPPVAEILSGTQAMVRLVADQLHADAAAALDTAALVSGYPGSPLGGFDQELARARTGWTDLHVVHEPAQNEELGATAVWGSQLAPLLRNPRRQGVLGVWYGKAPGVDRAADALRHGNFTGAHPLGGLLALCGDDPTSKSSTLPSASETLLAALGMPVFQPSDVQEVLDLGRHAIAASRASGLWTALKVTTQVADAVESVIAGPDRVKPIAPTVLHEGRPYVHRPSAELLGQASLDKEATLQGPRMALLLAYLRDNGLNRVVHSSPEDRIGLVASGSAYLELRDALRRLGLADDERGIRLLKLDVVWPLEPDAIRGFAEGLEEILVVEEKGPFVETGIRDLLYDLEQRPVVRGKRAENGAPLLPTGGGLDSDTIAAAVAARLRRLGLLPDAAPVRPKAARTALPLLATRSPFYCSGCPHNLSTAAPEGALVGAGIGCHTMVLLHPERRDQVVSATQMGGEGAQWIGQAPFVDAEHIFQNMGDGTFHHSGSLAVRASVAAGTNITYKLLYNSAVAMTGGQEVRPALSVPDLTRWLAAEGVRRVIVTTDEPKRYRGVRLAGIAEVRDRTDLMRAQEELAATPGVTVLVHDQQCAAEKRRLRGRGDLPAPTRRIMINERVCEGCGDCGHKSQCLSVRPVDTEFGRKTQIHQSSCNTDYSCVHGDCPAFLDVTVAAPVARTPVAPPSVADPGEPPRTDATIRFVGIGGTGVVTAARLLSAAAHLDGRHVRGLDQTGLAQKGGPVVSDVRIHADDRPRSNRAGRDGADVYLALDLLGATAPDNLAVLSAERTVAVVSTSAVPTGAMVISPAQRFPELDALVGAIEARTDRDRNVYLDAESLAERLFGDGMPANLIVLGAAWQRGLLPVSRASLERAIQENTRNPGPSLAAFGWGRAVVADPDAVRAAVAPSPRPAPAPDPAADALVARVDTTSDPELGRLLRIRVAELIAYQNAGYARRYVDLVARVRDRETALGTDGALTRAVARQLHRLMAYKDEYEVARLSLDPALDEAVAAEFGPGARYAYRLHPPVFRALGLRRKLALGRWFRPAFVALRALRPVRGTPLDLFGYARVRRLERALLAEYEEVVADLVAGLTPGRHALAVEIAELPDQVRGYEDVKLANAERYRTDLTALRRRWAAEEDALATR
ncbi:indolepyruvate ferredoxin oxidoreductase [Asanoa ishikariensis]|uniref:Indolepyruvate ferredoxin oxidoreductase n=1 Tax=Asanoa ishikariensis TaxID=137265 RepID=A0A1H3UZL5_9ACTN|nr:indolepyruvate ferredoxin oxidoreductase family protein [Asanoa ishikariensis]GIF70016.1 indolepyruvate ferredoxin oxidoreductase [Asanoa ishikariensis]SDZ67269.1 indolepyruvate ferredoxin oxidoreductase [Asanoa ishikariensis]